MPQYKNVVPLVALLVVLSSTPVTAQSAQVTPSASVLAAQPASSWKQVREAQQEKLENLKKERREYQEEVKTARQEQQDKAKAARQQYQQARQEAQQERKGFLTQAQQTIARRIYDVLKNRLTSRYQFLMSSKAKIQSRLNEKVAAGLTLTAAQAKLDQTKQYEAAYIKDLAALEAKLTEVLQSDKPLQAVRDLNHLAQAVTNDLNQLKKVEVEAMKLVIQAGKIPTTSPVPTAATTPSPTPTASP